MPTLPNIPAVLGVTAAGALIAYAAYRRSIKRRAHDLRTELLAEQASLRAAIEALPAQIDLAKRTAGADAAGNPATERMRQWLCELDLDLSEAELLKSQLSAAEADYNSLSDMDVEVKLVEVLSLSLRANALAEKYRASHWVRETNRESLTDDADALISRSVSVFP